MRPLRRALGSSRTTILPIRKRAKATVSAGSSVRRRRLMTGASQGVRAGKSRQSSGAVRESNIRLTRSSQPALRDSNPKRKVDGTRKAKVCQEAKGSVAVCGIWPGERQHLAEFERGRMQLSVDRAGGGCAG